MKIAAVAYQIDRLPDWAALKEKLSAVLKRADADLIVLPEYAAVEAALVGTTGDRLYLEWRDMAAETAERWVELWRDLAQEHACHVLAGTGPVQTERGVVNRGWMVSPNGAVAHQDKMILTPFERTYLAMVPGDRLNLIETALGRIGILICYDSEFPLLARSLMSAGADMILVPSFTDFPAGQTRVRQSCRARAIEGQCLIVHAPLVGHVAQCALCDQATGRAGLFGPPDFGQPADGILGQGDTDHAGPVVVTVDLAQIASARKTGEVGNFAHWPEQDKRIESVTSVVLR